MANGNESFDAVGGGFRVVFSPEMDTQQAEAVARNVKPGLNSLDESSSLKQPFSSVQGSGWGEVVHRSLLPEGNGGANHWQYLKVVPGPGVSGSYLVPNRMHFDGGRFKNQAMYRIAQVSIDPASQAQMEAEEAARQQDATNIKLNQAIADAKAQVLAATSEAAIAAARRDAAIAKAKLGQGYHAIELTMLGSRVGDGVILATSSYESASEHSGTSVITDGVWETLCEPGKPAPGDYGLPKPFIAAGPSGPRIATVEYRKILEAAKAAPPAQQGWFGQIFGVPAAAPAAGGVTAADISVAQQTLQALNLSW